MLILVCTVGRAKASHFLLCARAEGRFDFERPPTARAEGPFFLVFFGFVHVCACLWLSIFAINFIVSQVWACRYASLRFVKALLQNSVGVLMALL